MKKRTIIILFVLGIVVYWIFTLSRYSNLQNTEISGECQYTEGFMDSPLYTICTKQTLHRSRFDAYSATKETSYFAYSNDNCIDLYDNQGVFLLSIQFPEYRNGGFILGCDENSLYVLDKGNNYYHFSSAGLMEYLSAEEAFEKGISRSWIASNQDFSLKISRESITKYDTEGNIVADFETPKTIRGDIPMFSLPPIVSLIVILSMWIALLIYVISRLSKKEVPHLPH